MTILLEGTYGLQAEAKEAKVLWQAKTNNYRTYHLESPMAALKRIIELNPLARQVVLTSYTESDTFGGMVSFGLWCFSARMTMKQAKSIVQSGEFPWCHPHFNLAQ